MYLNNADENTVFNVEDFAVLEAICDGFLDDSRPDLCNTTGFFSIKDGELKDCIIYLIYIRNKFIDNYSNMGRNFYAYIIFYVNLFPFYT